MEHQIQFAKSDDGAAIASWRQGSGPPLVVATLPGGLWAPSTIVSNPATRTLYDLLAKHYTLVVFDARGMGYSQREVSDFSLDAATNDLRAVVDVHGLDRFDLLGFRGTSMAAVSFAAHYPGRVSRLVLRDPVLTVRDQRFRPRERALRELIAVDFDFYVDALSLSLAGWDAGRGLAEGAREGIDREAYLAGQAAVGAADAWEYLPQVSCPALVVHSRASSYVYPIDIARRATAAMQNATFAIIEGGSPYEASDAEEFAAVALAFFGDNRAPKALSPSETPSGTAIILFADIVDSTALTELLGDAAFREKARGLDEAMRAAVRTNGGTAIKGKTLGDGVLAVFTSAKQAITCAQACHEAATTAGLALHAGIHAGDVIREADNVYGGAVNIAARVAAASAAGETLVSGTVRELARTSAGVSFEDRGDQALKGIDDPVRLFAVRQA